MTHRQQQQQAKAAAAATVGPSQGVPAACDSNSSSITAAGLPWLGLTGLSGLTQAGSVQEEVRVRMTHVARQLAQLASQLVSGNGFWWIMCWFLLPRHWRVSVDPPAV